MPETWNCKTLKVGRTESERGGETIGERRDQVKMEWRICWYMKALSLTIDLSPKINKIIYFYPTPAFKIDIHEKLNFS